MIIKYLRKRTNGNGRGEPIGCVVGLDSEHIGYSLCHKLDHKKFTKKLAREIATKRAEKYFADCPNYVIYDVEKK